MRALRTTKAIDDQTFDAMLNELAEADERRGKTAGPLTELARHYRLDEEPQE